MPVIEKLRNDIKTIFQSEKPVELLMNFQNRNYLYKYLYLLTNVRGYKTICKYYNINNENLKMNKILYINYCSYIYVYNANINIIYIILLHNILVKFFSHEVNDLEATINFLVLVIENSQQCWETKYILLIWLSLIFMIPFDIKNVDSSATNEEVIFFLFQFHQIS